MSSYQPGRWHRLDGSPHRRDARAEAAPRGAASTATGSSVVSRRCERSARALTRILDDVWGQDPAHHPRSNHGGTAVSRV